MIFHKQRWALRLQLNIKGHQAPAADSEVKYTFHPVRESISSSVDKSSLGNCMPHFLMWVFLDTPGKRPLHRGARQSWSMRFLVRDRHLVAGCSQKPVPWALFCFEF